jgi:hypothetical protein
MFKSAQNIKSRSQQQGSGWKHLLERHDEFLRLFIDLLWKENHDGTSA